MAGNGLDLQKLFAMQAQLKAQLKQLENVTKKIMDVKYVKRDGTTDIRPVRIYIPDGIALPMPLVYVPHYEMQEDSLELREYLSKGWAVASCADFKNEFNSVLTFDDLVFNNAALYSLRNMSEIDDDKIAVVGGSAGGYTAMMLSAMQLGICATVANSPICNVYFNFHKYFADANKYNVAAFLAMPDEEKKNPLLLLSKLPLPFVGAICTGGGFTNLLNIPVPDFNDMSAWEAISPTAFAECYCNPVYINQATSDLLVPIDQLTKKYTYDKPGETMPNGYDYRMGVYEGKLNDSLCDRLDQSQLNLFKMQPIDGDDVKEFEFDKEKRYNVCICDEGAPEAYASHNLGTHTGRYTDVGYLEYMFGQGAGKTNVLTVDKLVLFAERYAGEARQLVAHGDVDDDVYGSLAVYRKEIIAELKKWKRDNGEKAIEEITVKAIETVPQYKLIIEEMISAI